jgi:molybdenum cofactor cytidylyltransferase
MMDACGIILLAGGTSARLGQPKQLLQYNGRSLLQHSVQAALQSGAGPVVLVTGAYAQQVRSQVQAERVHIVWNEHWQQGIASSITCGLQSLVALVPGVQRAAFMVCDQPFVTASLLQQLLQTSINTGKSIVASAYGGTVGIPAVFTNSYFNLLLQLTGDEGAKKLMRQHPGDLVTVAFTQGNIDIDTQADYDALNNGGL